MQEFYGYTFEERDIRIAKFQFSLYQAKIEKILESQFKLNLNQRSIEPVSKFPFTHKLNENSIFIKDIHRKCFSFNFVVSENKLPPRFIIGNNNKDLNLYKENAFNFLKSIYSHVFVIYEANGRTTFPMDNWFYKFITPSYNLTSERIMFVGQGELFGWLNEMSVLTDTTIDFINDDLKKDPSKTVNSISSFFDKYNSSKFFKDNNIHLDYTLSVKDFKDQLTLLEMLSV